jgi:hypothetical protein
MGEVPEDLLAKDRELQAAVQEAWTAERLARLAVLESEPGKAETNRQAWEAQQRVLLRLRASHQAALAAIREVMRR